MSNKLLIFTGALVVSVLFVLFSYYEFLNLFILILLNILIIIGPLWIGKKPFLSVLLFLHFFLYTFFLFIHRFYKKLYLSGNDDIRFEILAKNYYNQYLFGIQADVFQASTAYSKLISYIYILGKDNELIPGLLNITAHSLSIILLYGIYKEVFNKSKGIILTTLIFILYPLGLLTTVVTLRESIVTLFILMFTFFFLKFVKSKHILYFLGSLIAIYFGSIYHIGTIGLLMTFPIYYLFVNQSHFLFRILKAVPFILIGLGFLMTTENNKILTTLEGTNTAKDFSSSRTDYLSRGESSGIVAHILYRALQPIYFLLKPLPWDITTISDVIGFLNVLSIMLCLVIGLKIYFETKNKNILIILIIVLSLYLIFSFGTTNYGTALRHRDKASILLLMFLPYYLTKNRKDKNA